MIGPFRLWKLKGESLGWEKGRRGPKKGELISMFLLDWLELGCCGGGCYK